MNIAVLSPLFVFAFTLPAIDTTTIASQLPAPAPIEAAFDLGNMRAGAARVAAPLDDSLRAELVSATNPAFADMRAGSAPTDQEWTWIAIGAAAVVLLIILL
jgi:hypothetical protein